MGMTMNQDKIC